MPWTCGACTVELNDDVGRCPGCGAAKESWTVVADKTRAMRVTTGRARLEVLRGTSEAPLPRDDAAAGASVPFETAPAQVCPVVEAAALRRLVAAGQGPAPAHRLVARVWPRRQERRVVLAIDFAQAERREHEVDAEALPLSEDEAFDVQLVCVHGPEGADGIELPGLHVVDLSEEGGRGYAPAVSVQAVKRSVELPTEAVRAGPPPVELLEVEDICFARARAVLLPGGWSASDELTGLSVVAAALEHARRHPERRLVLAGHADPKGSVADNQALSEQRARSVYLYLGGQREAWAAHSLEHAGVADLQSVLKWIAWRFEWPCDPGAIDGDWGPGSQGALDAFRARHEQEVGGTLPRKAEAGAADWAALFDLYERELGEKLLCDPSRLAALRAGLRFGEPPYLGCSEHWPTERPGAPATDAARRRVDVLFFDQAALPALPGAPPGEPVYGRDRYQRSYLGVDDAFREPEPPYGDAPFEDIRCRYRRLHPNAAGQATAELEGAQA